MYKVKEHIEMSPTGENVKKSEMIFNTYNQAVNHIKNRMREIVKQDTLKFLSDRITTEKLERMTKEEFTFWLGNSTKNYYIYIASTLGYSCHWFIEN